MLMYVYIYIYMHMYLCSASVKIIIRSQVNGSIVLVAPARFSRLPGIQHMQPATCLVEILRWMTSLTLL